MDDLEIPQGETGAEVGSKMFNNYVESYGEPPPEIDLFKDPSKLWGIQEDIIKLASGKPGEAVQTPAQIHSALESNGIIVIPDSDDFLNQTGDAENCEILQSRASGKQVHQLHIGSVNFYQQLYGQTQREAEHEQLKLMAHAAGHAIDFKVFPGISSWGTEIRQQFFNLEYARVIGGPGSNQGSGAILCLSQKKGCLI
jgi:hypothetical protein